ncbi:MAG: GNAT family N-acetyltransferase [Actinomycetota bacterium]
MDDLLAPLQGFTTRALTVDDVDDAVVLANTCELHDVGYTMWEREDLTSDLRLPGIDVDLDSVGIWEDARLIGWGFMPWERRAWIDVHPNVRGRGIGTWLRRWSERRARDRGATSVGQTINDRAADAIRLLVAARYTPRSTSWILSMEHPQQPADPALPDGITLRTFRPGDEVEALGMFEDAFNEWPDRQPSTLETWRTMTVGRDGFASEDLVLAENELGEIVGGAFLIDSDEIWVDKLAVRRDHRHHGIARALLQVAFQRGFDRGYTVTSLSTDSNTGALTLYERVGMHVRESYANLAIDL